MIGPDAALTETRASVRLPAACPRPPSTVLAWRAMIRRVRSEGRPRLAVR
jgi:hypothetical protein